MNEIKIYTMILLTFNEWAIAPTFMNGHTEKLLDNCKELAIKFCKRGRSREVRDILNEMGYNKVSEMEGKTADLKQFHRLATQQY